MCRLQRRLSLLQGFRPDQRRRDDSRVVRGAGNSGIAGWSSPGRRGVSVRVGGLGWSRSLNSTVPIGV